HPPPPPRTHTLPLHDALPISPSSTTPNSPLPTCARRTANAIRASTETPEKAFPFNRSSGSFSAWASTLQTPLKRHRHAVLPHVRSEEHTSELQSRENLVCRLL